MTRGCVVKRLLPELHATAPSVMVLASMGRACSTEHGGAPQALMPEKFAGVVDHRLKVYGVKALHVVVVDARKLSDYSKS